MCRTSIYNARNNFSALVKEAEEGEVVELTKYDRPVAVIISYEEYEKLRGTKPNWLSEWREMYKDCLDDEGIPFERSRECPDPNNNPWD